MQVKVVVLAHGKDLDLPTYETTGSAGMDLRAAIDEPIRLNPMERALVPNGIKIALPQGYEAQVRPRSGLAVKHGVTVLNTPGTVDSDYRGELKTTIINLGSEPFLINRGDRIAQMIVAPVIQAEMIEIDSLDETERGEGGFGSTGV